MSISDRTKTDGIDLIQLISLVLSIYILGALAVQTLFKLSADTIGLLNDIDFIVCLFFLLDFFVGFYKAKSKRHFMKWGWLDLISSIPVLSVLQWTRVARIVRILRALRSSKILIHHLFRDRARGALGTAIFIAIIMIIFCSIAILNFEVDAPTANIKTPEDALWWAFTTISTVGYGDKFPVTDEGRIVAVLLIISGVGLFGVYTAFIASLFVAEGRREQSSELNTLIEEVREILSVDHAAVASAGTDSDSDEEKEEKDKEKEDRGLSKYQLIKAIRADFDLLWKAQRESLISHVRGLDLDPAYETTRKEAKIIKGRVKDACLQYWKKSNAYDAWIEELVWQDCDIQRKLRGTGCEEKFADAVEWLTKAKLIDEAGCYCFKEGKNYLYIGKAGTGDSNLGKRLRDHRRSVYFEHATHLRVIIPRYKMWISKLERLLLLSYPDAQYNDATPTMGHNPVDDILELLAKEMDDLLTDG